MMADPVGKDGRITPFLRREDELKTEKRCNQTLNSPLAPIPTRLGSSWTGANGSSIARASFVLTLLFRGCG